MKRFPTFFPAALAAGFLSLTCAQSFGALAQQAYVKASNNGAVFEGAEQFGTAVAIWGDTMVVGAPHEGSNATGVNGSPDPMGFGASGSGAAYIYVRNGTNWTSQAYLKASDSQLGFHFGSAVSIWSNTVVVGAPGVSDGQFGAAYVFVRNGAIWSEQAQLRPSNEGGDFGASVAVWSNTVVVGAYSESSDGAGVNGSQTPYNTPLSGAAYVFERSAGTWTQQAYLKASNREANDEFGVAVGISGDTVVVGARGEDSNATKVNGNQNDNSNSDSGAAYVFVRSGGTWTQPYYLKASSGWSSQAFGSSIAVAGDTIVVGAPDESGGAIGVNGNPDGEPTHQSGAAFVFFHNGTAWTPQAYLKASNTGQEDHFGIAVAVSGNIVVVGARDEDSSAAGVNGNQSSNGATNSGAAYLFARIGTNWSHRAYLKASNPGGGTNDFEPADAFGSSVGISGDTMVMGAPGEDSNAIGVNGNQGDNSLLQSGAAYVFAGALATGPGYVSEPAPGSTIDFGSHSGSRIIYVGNEGSAPLTIQYVYLSSDRDLWFTLKTAGGTVVVLPHTIPVNATDEILQIDVNLKSSAQVSGRDVLSVVSDDPVRPDATYDVIHFFKNEFQSTYEGTIIGLLNRIGAGNLVQSGKYPRLKSFAVLPQTATFTVASNSSNGMTAEMPSFFGGGSVVLTNFSGSFTVSLRPIPNDTNRAAVRVESGSFTAPSFTLPSGLVSGPNVLTFGPPEQSSGLLYFTNGHYEVTATATITNSLIPNGVTVRGSYTGIYNFETGQASLQSDSRDLFEASERVQLNHSPTGLWLTWANTNAVEEATNILGPWRTVTNALSPYLVVTTNHPQQFFRLRLPEP